MTKLDNHMHLVMAFVGECMSILGHDGFAPSIEIRDNLGSTWLGRTIFDSKTGIVRIEIQKRALEHEETRQRVIAHEVAHCVEFVTLPDADFAMLKLGKYPDHGPHFRDIAKELNLVLGEDFVTEKSDDTYQISDNERELIVVIEETYRGSGRLGWTWAQKPSKAGEAIVAKKVANGAVVVKTVDDRFTKGARIGKGKIGMSLPSKNDTEMQDELERLWKESKG